MSSQSAILRSQQTWARATGRTPKSNGYFDTVEANLWRPLSEQSRAAFEKGGGKELQTKMLALHSSSALAVNFFEYWTSADCMPLVDALSLDSPMTSVIFEAQYPTGLKGIPPNLDVCIRLASGHTVAIESKFCEWLGRKSPNKENFKPKYFPAKSSLWTCLGLPKCQDLATDIRDRREHFIHLDVPQLLKHALGLTTTLDARFDLYYVYFDWPGPESAKHRAEITRFSERVGLELRFKAFSYQDLFARVRASKGVNPSYVSYLQQRYFANG
jgi:hypothetical protein